MEVNKILNPDLNYYCLIIPLLVNQKPSLRFIQFLNDG